MKPIFDGFVFEKPTSLAHQVSQKIRELIQSGQLVPGTRLPSTHELAARWNITSNTVHLGMLPLVKEGLIVRSPKHGTFVQKREKKLTRVGIYLLDNYNARDGSPFARSVAQETQSILHEQGIEPDVWVDSRPHAKQGQPWPDLARAARERRIQGLIVPQAGPPVIDWVSKLPIPWSVFSALGQPNMVALSKQQFVTMGLRALAEQGCRSVGFMDPLPSNPVNPDGTVNPYALGFETFIAVCKELGLEFRSEWIFDAQQASQIPYQLQGHVWVHRLWSYRRQPEGLLIVPDNVAVSAVPALLQLGVRVPETLKLVLHKNQHMSWFCPVPATFLVSDEARIAAALIEQVQKQFRGERCAPITISFDMVPNEASKQIEQYRMELSHEETCKV